MTILTLTLTFANILPCPTISYLWLACFTFLKTENNYNICRLSTVIPVKMPCIEDKSSIISTLRSLNCCARCIVRFLGYKDLEDSSEPFLHPEEFITEPNPEPCDPKKPKSSPCRSCLGILEDPVIEKIVAGISLDEANHYNEKSFTVFVSLPKVLLLRDHSMSLYLKEKFPEVYKQPNSFEDMKKVFRISAANSIGKQINKTFQAGSDLQLLVDISYPDDEFEVENLSKLYSKNVSRSNIGDILDRCDEASFRKHFAVPPESPHKEVTAKVSFSTVSIYLGGRYLKFSRDMGQTPWVINGKVMAEHCLSDIIFNSICKVLGYDKTQVTFCASGREDADVRMLGNGRPFYIQVDNPKNSHISFEDCHRIEEDILSTKLAAVVGLQKVDANDIKWIKTGEQEKKKHYSALCHTKSPDVKAVVDKLNSYACPFELHQKTPLRVLHRRAQSTRSKMIYEMSAAEVGEHLFYLDVVTSAGTYVKEFVHGDFMRTEPNVISITGFDADLIALDVTKIELEWPLQNPAMAQAPRSRSIWMLIIKNFVNSLTPRQFKGTHMGTDYFGNKYYEIAANATLGRRRQRWFDPPVKDDFMQEMPAEWEAWLRGRRKEPPSEQEVLKNLAIMQMKKKNAIAVDAKGGEMTPMKKGVETFPKRIDYETVPGKRDQ
ncbi:unnamed protein product [Acanthoscelides obtectus]|uniref:tRNA pseudouridine(55) synthase n=1 Tax=Acanthoscelides obtectus TaxID=200917 RepID=A0A9P0M573_ACAOB|nr:unnamed protein product [Acanthoscelides obtectus]CAK1670310.1 Putative tRNA pseudouridine synthase Pus10 [Acanthoscelides obtectus]